MRGDGSCRRGRRHRRSRKLNTERRMPFRDSSSSPSPTISAARSVVRRVGSQSHALPTRHRVAESEVPNRRALEVRLSMHATRAERSARLLRSVPRCPRRTDTRFRESRGQHAISNQFAGACARWRASESAPRRGGSGRVRAESDFRHAEPGGRRPVRPRRDQWRPVQEEGGPEGPPLRSIQPIAAGPPSAAPSLHGAARTRQEKRHGGNESSVPQCLGVS